MELSKLKSLERLRKLLDIRMTDPNILESLIRESIKQAHDFTSTVSKQLKTAIAILEKCTKTTELIIPLEKSVSNESTRCAGIDGSNQVVGGSTNRFYIMIASSVVILPHGLKTKQPIIKQSVAPIIKYTRPHPEDVKSVSEDMMMIWETLTLGKVLELMKNNGVDPRGTLVFIDGPIIDPPRKLKEESSLYLSQITGEEPFELIGKNTNDVSKLIEEFHNIRASIIRELLDEGIIVVGYVKRPFTEFLLSQLLIREKCADISLLTIFNGDKELAHALLLASEHKFPKATKFVEYPIENELYTLYYMRQFRIVYSYLLNNLKGGISRIEIALPLNLFRDTLEFLHTVLNSIVSITPSGMKHPLPVILAHDKCTIRKGVAEVLYEEIITRGLNIETDDPTLLLMKLRMM